MDDEIMSPSRAEYQASKTPSPPLPPGMEQIPLFEAKRQRGDEVTWVHSKGTKAGIITAVVPSGGDLHEYCERPGKLGRRSAVARYLVEVPGKKRPRYYAPRVTQIDHQT